jgi:hypothetical protein
MSYSHARTPTYVQFNDEEEVKALDQPVWGTWYGLTPDGSTGRHLYVQAPEVIEYPFCDQRFLGPAQYNLSDGNQNLPDHSSRFGYNRCAFGYCSGHWPGRYNDPNLCAEYDPQPSGTAPERFYTAAHQGPFNSISQGTVDYEWMKNYGMNYITPY